MQSTQTRRINTKSIAPSFELWTKVEPAYSITCPRTISYDAYCYEVPLQGCSWYLCLPELATFFEHSASNCRNVWARPCPQCMSFLGMEQSVCIDSSNNDLPLPKYWYLQGSPPALRYNLCLTDVPASFKSGTLEIIMIANIYCGLSTELVLLMIL